MMNTALRRVRLSPFPRAGPCDRRTYAFQASGAPIFEVFNQRTKWMQRERAAANVEGSRQADYLKDEVATRLCERLLVNKHTYTTHIHTHTSTRTSLPPPYRWRF